MKYASRPSRQVQALPRVLLEARPLSPEAWALVLVYILLAYRKVDQKTLRKEVRAVMPERENELESLALRQWKAEWRAEGVAEGEAKGEARGRASTLRRILQRRFGEIPQATLERLDGADISQLDAWVDRAIDAKTLDAVFLDAPH